MLRCPPLPQSHPAWSLSHHKPVISLGWYKGTICLFILVLGLDGPGGRVHMRLSARVYLERCDFELLAALVPQTLAALHRAV
jgi:hypothetical protein